MYLKLEGTVRQLLLTEELDFSYSGPHAITVVLRPPTQEEEKAGRQKENAMSTATGSLDPSSRIAEAFLTLSRNDVPEGCSIPEDERAWFLDERGKLKPGIMLKMDFLPKPFRDFSQQISAELWDYTRRTARVLRWRLAQEGPHNPFSSRGLFWSLDGTAWLPLPGGLKMKLSAIEIRTHATNQEREDVLSIVQSGKSEPLGHELYREASEHRFVSPRSALIIGIAALEVGFKNFVSELVPETRWLLENLQSPPLHRLLVEYLPLIRTKNTVDGKVLPPPPRLIETIKNGVTKRNIVAHIGTAVVGLEEVEELLLAVRDVLWLLDFYGGLGWAFENIRPEVRKELHV